MSMPGQEVQAQFVRQPPRLPLVNRLQNRYSSSPLTQDARLINCYAEFDPEERVFNVVKRPGLSSTPAFTSAAALAVGGCGMYTHAATGVLVYGFRRNTINGAVALYSSTNPVPMSTADVLLGDNRPLGLTFETINSNPQTIFVGGGGTAVLVNTSTWTDTVIADPDFTVIARVPGAVYLNQTLYVMDYLGRIFGSDPDNGASWNPLNVIPANNNADLGVALAKQLSYVVALKQYTTQIFYDAGNTTGSPLAPLPDSQIALGCAAAMSVQQIDNSLLWLSANETSSPQIVQMDNLTPKVVSTPAVERILLNLGVTGGLIAGVAFIQFSGVYSWVLKHSGHRFYGLTLTSLNLTLIYDLDQQLWYIWGSPTGGLWPIFSMAYIPPGSGLPGVHYAQQANGLNIYPLNEDKVYPTDSGVLFPVDIYTPNVDMQSIRAKMWSSLYFCGDRVPGSTLQVRFSDDDYTTWSNFRPVDLSQKKPFITGLGTSDHRRAYHFRHNSPTAMRLRYVAPNVDLGTL